MPKRDREQEWQAKHGAIEEERAIRDSLDRSFETNPDRFLAILEEVRRNPELVKQAKNAGRNLPSVDGEDAAPASVSRTLPHDTLPVYQTAPEISSKYAQVVNRLDRFPFSEDPTVLKQQMTVVEGALRTAMQDLINKAVATNTKKAFKQYCTRIQKVAGGLTITYNFGEKDIFVTAKGNFFGDETICIQDVDGKKVASIIVIDGEDATDTSKDFDIQVK
jgi:hypothetical protein